MVKQYIEAIQKDLQNASEVNLAQSREETSCSTIFPLLFAHLPEGMMMLGCLWWLKQAQSKMAPASATLVLTAYLGYKTVDSFYPAYKPNQKRHHNLEGSNHAPLPM